MAQEDYVDTKTLGLVLGVGAILTLVTVVGVQALYFAGERHEYERKEVRRRYYELTDVTAEQRAALEEYEVVDPERGIVSIPIERAMELVRKERAGGGR